MQRSWSIEALMRSRTPILIVLLVWTGRICAQDVIQPASRPMPQQQDATMLMTLPAPISDADLLRYGEYLDLSAAQSRFLHEAYQRYRTTHASIIKARLPELDALNAEACRFEGGVTHALVAANEAFHGKEKEADEQLAHADAAFLDELRPVLSEQQIQQLPRVLNHRARARCSMLALRAVYASRIDLSALVDEIVADRAVLQQIDRLLLEYEQQLTPLTVHLEERIRAQEQGLLELIAWEQRDDVDAPLPVREQVARGNEVQERRLALLEPSAVLQRAIASLNNKTLAALVEQLPADRAAILRVRYADAAFPVIYRVGNDNAFDLCDRLAAVQGLNKEQHDALIAQCETYRESYKSMCAEMERLTADWQDEFARTRGMGPKYEPYRLAMRDLRDKRWRATLAFLRQVESLVPHDAAPDIGDACRDLRRMIENAIRDSQQDPFPGV
jgi:hypothetical protein